MKYTRDKPTQEGWYFRHEHHKFIGLSYTEVIHLTIFRDELCDHYLDPISEYPEQSYYWCGPIEEPEPLVIEEG